MTYQVQFRCRPTALAAALLLVCELALAGNGIWTTNGPGPVRALAVDPVATDTLYAGSASASGTGGLFKSLDAGNTWETKLVSQAITAVAVASPNTVYFGNGSGEIFKSTDGAATWVRIVPATELNQSVGSLAIDPLNPQIIYRMMASNVGYEGPQGGQTFRSDDGGVSWTLLEGLGYPLVSLDPQHSGTLYAAMGTQVFKSVDFGASLSALPASGGKFVQFLQSLAVDPFDSSTIYVGTASDGVFKSLDGGASFKPASAGLPSLPIRALLPDSAHPGRIFAGTLYGVAAGEAAQGVFLSTDGGASWNAMNAGLTRLNVPVLAIDRTGTFLHAGTDAGVFDIQLGAEAPEVLTAVVPVAISAPGAGSSYFRTSVQLRHPLDTIDGQPLPAPVVGRIVFHSQATSGTSRDPSLSFTLYAGSVLAIPDVLAAIGQTGIGSLDILTTSDPALIGLLRVFNDAGAAGTYGFTEDAVAPSGALETGDRGILLAPPDLTQFRWNIGIRTLGAGATVTLTVHDAQGALTRTATRSFGPNVMLQSTADAFIVDDAHPGPQPRLGANASLTVQIAAGSAFVYGATADNKTNDPSFQLARRVP